MEKSFSPLLQTPLHSLHLKHEAKMTDFAGYELPIHYSMGILKEHQHVRQRAGLFDVSHMGQLTLSGPSILKNLESIFPLDIDAMSIDTQSYTVLLNEQGGILDDLIITRQAEDKFFIVVNAACKLEDIRYLRSLISEENSLDELENALLALQGPDAARVMNQICPDLNDLIFMQGKSVLLFDIPCYVTRSGYTGEDGFELSIPKKHAETIAKNLLNFKEVELIGLGARDSLRLESGLCLYGHDLNEQITPVEGAINFAIAKTRRATGIKQGGFVGADKVLKQLTEGVAQKRVGFIVNDRAPVREGTEIQDKNGKTIGKITSGGFGVSLNKPIAMGYVAKEFTPIGTELFAIVRGKARAITVTKMPFVTQNYYRG